MRERNAELARAIAHRHGIPPIDVVALPGGFVNHSFAIGPPDARVVLRFAVDPHRRDDFDIEAWCLGAAASAGIASPRLLVRGEEDDVPYLVQEFVDGRHPVQDSAKDTDDTWHRLGALAARVSDVALTADAPVALFSRFGRDLPRAWASHVDYNLAELSPTDPLIDWGVYPAAAAPILRQELGRLRDAPFTFGLRHGDLAPRNVILRDGEPVLLDWGAASAGPAPLGDVLSVFRWHVTEGSPDLDSVRIFAEQCGLDWTRTLPDLEAMLALEALDLVRWSMAWRPDLLDDYRVSAATVLSRFLPPIL
ncbi:phosphotransferase family protein [Planctomonas psychrotolerans]|uniref:phosphotransferase family protein n=1 Tax=Planctomonas psychrotolerans TaxID=2528712 RepID=UPI0012396D91|nr:aminoglycoside phosphotransferase family protein [Planctomonas psychrotolerans]